MSAYLADEEFKAVIRTDFGFFGELCFRELHNGMCWTDAGYLRLIERLFSSCHARAYRRVILNMPPRHMKSLFASVIHPVWRLGHEPSAKIICASYSEKLSDVFSRQARQLMRTEWYRDAFPHTNLSNEKLAVGHIETTAGGRIFSTTPGGTLAGIGATDIILDDIMKPQDAHSSEAREKLLNWFQSEVLNRFDNPAQGVLILVMHRLHPDDISHSLEQTGSYLTIKLPLIAEDSQRFTDSESGKILFERQPGDILNPAHVTAEVVERIKRETAPNVFAARYQQHPVAAGAGLIRSEWFARYKDPPERSTLLQSWDIATTLNAGDYSVCSTWVYHADKFYLIDIFRKQIEFPDLRKAVQSLAEQFEPRLICIETVGAGQALYQDLVRVGMKNLFPCLATKDKVVRMEECTPFIKDGYVLLPSQAPWLHDFLNEVLEFPQGKYDDQVDSMSQLINYRVSILDRARIKSKWRLTAQVY